MIACAPDMTAKIAVRLGVEPCVLVVAGGGRPVSKLKVFLDVGIAGAKRGVDVATYIASTRRIKPTWAVVPDVFGDFRRTLAQWLRYAPLISRYTAPVFVAQEFHKPGILDVLLHDLRRLGVARVALPMRRHPDVSCSSEPRLCAERAERALRALCGAVEHVHLLGPALRSVKMLRGALRQCERQGTVVSFDTSAYRRAPNQQVKRQLGGRWMPNSHEEAVAMLEAWLRQALAL
jgi:hypothetical protein